MLQRETPEQAEKRGFVMKRELLAVLMCAAACVLIGCGQNTAENSKAPETTEAATETTEATTTTVTTTTVETTVTTTTTKPEYLLAENIALEVNAGSVRATGCTYTLTNSGENNQSYTKKYRLLDPETEKELPLQPDAEEQSGQAAGVIAPEGSVELTVQWEKRYGTLNDGVYLLEAELEQVKEEPAEESSEAEPLVLPKVVRAEFEINSEGFVPRVYIDPATVTPEHCTLTIQNSPDVGRSYTMIYRMYNESGATREHLLTKIDMDSRLQNRSHLEPGEKMELNCNWHDELDSLLEGHYAIEVDLLPDDGGDASSYRAEFVIE